MRQAQAFAARLGLPFRDLGLLERALVHSSWLHEHPGEAPGHNERLELLGDAVVNLAIADALHDRHPDDDEGVLSARRAAIVSASGLAQLAERIDLGEHLLLGAGEARGGGRRRPLLLASGFEAVVGAVFLDLGWDAARDLIVGLATPELTLVRPPSAFKSPKSRLQELTQQIGHGRPAYEIVEASGPDHRREFEVRVAVDGRVLGRGSGPSRRTAETAAALAAIAALQGEGIGAAEATAAGNAPAADPAEASR